MKKPVFSDPKDFLALASRRKWWIILCTLLVFPVVALIVMTMPDIYVSQTTILVEPKDVPDDMVRDLISVSTEERMSAVQETILSRTNLLRIAQEFEEDLEQLKNLDNEGRVNTLRDDIGIETSLGGRRGSSVSYFRISYENQDPDVAQKIASRLAGLFVEFDNRSREDYVFGTVDFLQSELDTVIAELQVADDELTILKRRFSHELPENLDSNQRALDRLQMQDQANQESMDRLRADRLSVERQMSEIPPVLVESMTAGTGISGTSTPSPLVQEYRDKERQYNDLRTRYKEAHPTVRQLKAELTALRERIPPEDLIEIQQAAGLETTNVTRPNPAYQALQKQLDEITSEIDINKSEREWIDGQIELYRRRIDNTPSRERQIASVQRNHDDLNERYQDLKAKLDDAKLSSSLENKQKGSQFLVLDPANFPLHPSKPNRPVLLALGLAGCIGLGIVIGFAVDLGTQKFWTYSEVESLLGMPVLAEIPEILTEHDLVVAKKRKAARFALASSVVVLVLGAGTLLYSSSQFRELAAQHFDQLVEWTAR